MNYYLQILDSNLVNDMIGSRVIEIRSKKYMKEIIESNEIEFGCRYFWEEKYMNDGIEWWKKNDVYNISVGEFLEMFTVDTKVYRYGVRVEMW